MTTTENEQKLWHLNGNWTPMLEEITANDLKVEGKIPEALSGTYLRVGPNPSSGWSPHWFFGDGMLHGISLENGKALGIRIGLSKHGSIKVKAEMILWLLWEI